MGSLIARAASSGLRFNGAPLQWCSTEMPEAISVRVSIAGSLRSPAATALELDDERFLICQ